MKIAVTSRSFSQNITLKNELLERYPGSKFNDRGASLANDNLIEFLTGFERAITGLEKIDSAILQKLPQLKVISKYGVGLDMLDFDAFDKHNVQLGWTPGVNSQGVAELALTMMLGLLRGLFAANSDMKAGVWKPRVGKELKSCRVGIIGCGHVGKKLIQLLQPFTCEILVFDIREYPDFYRSHNIRAVPMQQCLSEADIVSLHIPLNTQTRGLFNRELLQHLKSNAFLINTSRGGIIDESEVRSMLQTQKLAGLGMDVFKDEPVTDFGLSQLPNVFTTPHIGGSSVEAQLAMGRAAIANLENFKPSREFLKWL